MSDLDDTSSDDHDEDINQKYYDRVLGYIRQCKSLLTFNIKEIPDVIKYCILLFCDNKFTLDSDILSKDERDELFKSFESQSKFQDIGVFEYKLIYASYRDGFGQSLFEEFCHNQPNLLCLVEAANGLDTHKFGGFTEHGWKRTNDNDDGEGHKDDKAFIFKLKPDKASILNSNGNGYELWTEDHFYCIFGQDVAFYIDEDGRTGGCNDASCNNFEDYPSEYFVTGCETFNVDILEVFQLTKYG